jgi:phosphatidylglycerophosphatase A
MRNLIKTIGTFFYSGYFPILPGTFASMVAIFLFYLMRHQILLHILFTLGLIILGLLVGSAAEEIFNQKDAKCIVIDEVAGMLLSFMFIPFDMKFVIIGFILFRLLDALKPYPADRLQKFKGGIGIMGDDLVAGLYTNIVLQFVSLRGASLMTS